KTSSLATEQPSRVRAGERPFFDRGFGPIRDEGARPCEPGSLDDLALDTELRRASSNGSAVLPLARIAGESQQRYLIELILRALPGVRQLDTESVRDNHLE